MVTCRTGGRNLYDVAEDASVSKRRVFAQPDLGHSDGLAVDERGCVWTAACWAGMRLRSLTDWRSIETPREHTGVRMPTVRVGDIEIYYERAGAGPRLLFIGGSGGDLRQKPSVHGGGLAREFDLVAFDQRGLGRSGKPARAYEMADYADDAAGLLAHLGWDDCRLLGVSFGGMVAQELALRHPDRVERMVLACTSSGGGGGASYPLHELFDLPARERAERTVAANDTRVDARWREENPEKFEAMVAFALDRQSALEPDGIEGARRQLDARRRHDTWQRLHEIRIPTLLCGGLHDGIAPVANQRALASRLPNARLELFDGGHLFLLEDRTAFPRISEFLKAERGELAARVPGQEPEPGLP